MDAQIPNREVAAIGLNRGEPMVVLVDPHVLRVQRAKAARGPSGDRSAQHRCLRVLRSPVVMPNHQDVNSAKESAPGRVYRVGQALG